MREKIKSLFSKNKSNQVESQIEKERIKNEVHYLIRDKINSIKEALLSIKSLNEFFLYYGKKLSAEKGDMDNLIENGRRLSGVWNDALKLNSYIYTLDKYFIILKRYKDNKNSNTFLKFFTDREDELLLIFCDYTAVFSTGTSQKLNVLGVYQSSNVCFENNMANNVLKIDATYNFEINNGVYTLEVDKIKAGDDRRRHYHGRYGMECLKIILREINTIFKSRKEEEKCIIKMWGYISPDENDIPYLELSKFYKDICGAKIINGNFEIDIES